MKKIEKFIDNLILESVGDFTTKVISNIKSGNIKDAFNAYRNSPTGTEQGITRSAKSFLATPKGREFLEGENLENFIKFTRESKSFRVGITDREIRQRASEIKGGTFSADNSKNSGRKKLKQVETETGVVRARESKQDGEGLKGEHDIAVRLKNIINLIKSGQIDGKREIEELKKIDVTNPKDFPKLKEAAKTILKMWFPGTGGVDDTMNKEKFKTLKNEKIGSDNSTSIERAMWRLAYDGNIPGNKEASAILKAIIKTKTEGIELLDGITKVYAHNVGTLGKMSKDQREDFDKSIGEKAKAISEKKTDSPIANRDAMQKIVMAEELLKDIEKDRGELEKVYGKVSKIAIENLKGDVKDGKNIINVLKRKESKRIKDAAGRGNDTKADEQKARAEYDKIWQKWLENSGIETKIKKIKEHKENFKEKMKKENPEVEVRQRYEEYKDRLSKGEKQKDEGPVPRVNVTEKDKMFDKQEELKKQYASIKGDLQRARDRKSAAKTESERDAIERQIEEKQGYLKTIKDKHNEIAEKTGSKKLGVIYKRSKDSPYSKSIETDED